MKYLFLALYFSTQLFSMRHHSEAISLIESSGKASAKAEFVQLNISVHAECYENIEDMLNASNKEANRIKEVISSLSNPALGDNVCITPGMISSFQRSTGWGENEHKTCEGTWQVTHRIKATYHDVDNFSNFYNQLIQQMSVQGSKELKESFIQSSLNGYNESVSCETEKKLKNEAFQNAYNNACSKFEMICDKPYKTSFSNVAPLSVNDSARNYSMLESASLPKMSDSSTIEASVNDCIVTNNIFVTFTHPAICCKKHNSSDEDDESFSLAGIGGR